jgi:hypothetical protein
MKAHLLNWTLGPAFLGAIFGSFGNNPPAPPGPADWRGVLAMIATFAGFFSVAWLILMAIMVVAARLIRGRFDWAEVRLVAAVMAIKFALLVFAVAMLVIVAQLATIVTGGWAAGWRAAAIGALLGAAAGLPSGLAVARLRLPQRLGLDTAK